MSAGWILLWKPLPLWCSLLSLLWLHEIKTIEMIVKITSLISDIFSWSFRNLWSQQWMLLIDAIVELKALNVRLECRNGLLELKKESFILCILHNIYRYIFMYSSFSICHWSLGNIWRHLKQWSKTPPLSNSVPLNFPVIQNQLLTFTEWPCGIYKLWGDYDKKMSIWRISPFLMWNALLTLMPWNVLILFVHAEYIIRHTLLT